MSYTADKPKAPAAPKDEKDDCECNKCASNNPVNFFNGEVVYSEQDLIGPVGGFGHSRTFSNRLEQSYEGPNGNSWLMPDWPYLCKHSANVYVFVRGQEQVWFDESNGTYTARNANGVTYGLTEDTGNSLLILTKRNSIGVETFKFHDFSSGNKSDGMLDEHTDAYGNKCVALYDDLGNDAWITELQYTVGSEDEAYSILYEYYPSGEHTNRIQYATMRKTTDINPTGDPPPPVVWTDIRRVEYDYYEDHEDDGATNDLRLVTVQKPASGGGWDDVSKTYYRYYKEDYFYGALKYVVSPIAWAEMQSQDPAIDPETASDTVIAEYADYYFKYDSDLKVEEEISRNCSGCGGGGTGDGGELFDRTENTGLGSTPGYNEWKWKVVLTKANGNIETVYTNYLGQVLLKELKEDSMSSRKWVTTTQYGTTAGEDAGKVVQTSSPAAFTSYDDTQNDLDITLKTGDGLITYNTYYSTTGSGAVKGYLEKVEISEGTSGTKVTQRELEYTTNGDAVRISKETVYTDDAGTDAVETSYAYTWYSGTDKVEQVTTTLPIIPTAQHGTNTAETTKQYFDSAGRMTFSQDERGMVTKNTYNQVTGLMTKSQVDVNTGLPTGWTGLGNTDLTTNYFYDDLGRQTLSLGPEHDADTGATTARDVRHANWTVYVEAVESDQTWSGQGYGRLKTGGTPDPDDRDDYTYTLIDPVSIAIMDKRGRTTDQITSARSTGSGALSDTDTFLRADWNAWSVTLYNLTGLLTCQRDYHDIPSQSPDQGLAGYMDDIGLEGADENYNESFFAYDDETNLRIKTLSPDKTITRSVYDAINRPSQTWIGTNDTGATASDPSNGGSGGNNMVQVSENEYDSGNAGGDSFLTKTTLDIDGNTASERETVFTYDFRGRRLTTDGEEDLFLKNTYDNLDRVTKTQRYDTTEAAANLVGQQETFFDDRSRVYETKVYEVDPTNGTVGNALVGGSWYDPAGNVTKSIALGAGEVWTQNEYDNIGRQTRSYTGYDDAGATNGEVVVEDSETTYNDASQATRLESHQLDTNAAITSQTYRTMYTAMLYDGIGRSIATVDYGTTDPASGSGWPGVVPDRSDTVLVSSTAYNGSTGRLLSTTDPGGIVTRTTFDDMGRVKSQIDNFKTGSGPFGDDENRTTLYTYTADSQTATLIAVAAVNQTTTYVYGVDTAKGSALAANNLLYAIQYPEDSSSSRIEMKYNRVGEVTEREDQNGTTHEYSYDLLGRPTADVASNLGTNIDGGVRRLTTSYNNRGLPEYLTSWSTTSGTSGGEVNQAYLSYNDFAQLTSDWQEHGGAVQTSGGSTSLRVQYAYAPGSSGGSSTNQIRATSMTYPDGREIEYRYGTAGALDDQLNRPQQVYDGTAGENIIRYDYLGLGTAVRANYVEPDIRWDIWNGVVGSYSGLDQFNRQTQSRRIDYGNTPATRASFHQYGYNRNSIPTYREDVTDSPTSDPFSELYGRDGLDRLNNFQRGTLNAGHTAMTTKTFEQDWTLNQTANWLNFNQDNNGNGTDDLVQTRTNNKVNEITGITNTTGGAWNAPSYDAAGNTTQTPRPDDPTTSTSDLKLTYDAWNRVVKATDNAGSPNTLAEYQYDARNFRVVRKLYTAGTHDATWHDYFTSSWQCIEEREQDPTTSDPPELRKQYVWGLRYVFDLAQRKRDTTGNGALDETLYALNDRQFNVVALADDTGSIVQRMTYSPYGEVKFLTSGYGSSTNTKDWDYLFQGLRLDKETNLYYNNNRYLQWLTGRFITRDPLGYPDGMNAYAAYYILKYSFDPFGLDQHLSDYQINILIGYSRLPEHQSTNRNLNDPKYIEYLLTTDPVHLHELDLPYYRELTKNKTANEIWEMEKNAEKNKMPQPVKVPKCTTHNCITGLPINESPYKSRGGSGVSLFERLNDVATDHVESLTDTASVVGKAIANTAKNVFIALADNRTTRWADEACNRMKCISIGMLGINGGYFYCMGPCDDDGVYIFIQPPFAVFGTITCDEWNTAKNSPNATV